MTCLWSLKGNFFFYLVLLFGYPELLSSDIAFGEIVIKYDVLCGEQHFYLKLSRQLFLCKRFFTLIFDAKRELGYFCQINQCLRSVRSFFFQREHTGIFLASVPSIYGLFNTLNFRFGRITSCFDGNSMLRFGNEAHLIITYTKTT